MSFTLFDAIVAAIVLISAVLAMVRGFVREVLSVASWVLAAVAAYYFYEPLQTVILDAFDMSETVAGIIAAAVIFFVALLILSYITVRIADFVIDSRVGAVDRLLGFVFGAVRGILLVVIAFFFFTWLVPVAEQPSWIANAQSRPILEDFGEQLVSVLPDDIEADLLARLNEEPAALPAPAAEGEITPPEGAPLVEEPPATPIYDQDQLDRLFNQQQPAQPAPAPAPQAPV